MLREVASERSARGHNAHATGPHRGVFAKRSWKHPRRPKAGIWASAPGGHWCQIKPPPSRWTLLFSLPSFPSILTLGYPEAAGCREEEWTWWRNRSATALLLHSCRFSSLDGPEKLYGHQKLKLWLKSTWTYSTWKWDYSNAWKWAGKLSGLLNTLHGWRRENRPRKFGVAVRKNTAVSCFSPIESCLLNMLRSKRTQLRLRRELGTNRWGSIQMGSGVQRRKVSSGPQWPWNSLSSTLISSVAGLNSLVAPTWTSFPFISGAGGWKRWETEDLSFFKLSKKSLGILSDRIILSRRFLSSLPLPQGLGNGMWRLVQAWVTCSSVIQSLWEGKGDDGEGGWQGRVQATEGTSWN